MYEESVRRRLPLAQRRPVFGLLGRVYPKLDWAPGVVGAKSTFQSLALSTVDAYFNTVSVIPDSVRRGLYAPQFARQLQGYRARNVLQSYAERVSGLGALSLVPYVDHKTYLCGDILTNVDRASMAQSLELRVPMHDHRFREWVAMLPPHLKLRGRSSAAWSRICRVTCCIGTRWASPCRLPAGSAARCSSGCGH
jgi:asparagine synthase (glutamine-hydrolysing)